MMDKGSSLLPYTTHGYVGLNAGVSDYRGGCSGAFGCDDTDQAFKVYTGGLINQWIGAEFGYLHLGKVDRNGGSTRAHGLNLSLVLNVPVTEMFEIHGRAGATYGRTKTTAAAGLPRGGESDWGPAWGIGAGLNLTPQFAVVLDWDHHRFEFAGGRDHVTATTLGVRYQF